ncbi:MAG: alpha/beta hydrolase fold protein [Solirubrobacterales bacterium]|nr:alpha/beta hydrolase fold protein [Solirubrobacterales bacterium]
MSVEPDTEAASRTSPAGARAEVGADAGVRRSPWLDIDWREHQRWVVVDGQPVNVIELGPQRASGLRDGDAHGQAVQSVVFVHGLAGSWPNWLEQLPVLAADHRVIALDLPGFGHSPMPREEISISGYARLLDRVLDQLQIDAAAIVGNSMGGFIDAELAIAFPQRVERLVLVSAAGISTYADPRTTRALPTLRHLERTLAAGAAWVASKSDAVAARRRLREATLNLVVAHPGRLPAALAAEQIRGAGKPGFLQALQALAGYDVRDRLPEIACPTLIVWGERDRLISVRDADVFEELIPNARKVVFADTGHMAMLERPAEFNALLEDFLGE